MIRVCYRNRIVPAVSAVSRFKDFNGPKARANSMKWMRANVSHLYFMWLTEK